MFARMLVGSFPLFLAMLLILAPGEMVRLIEGLSAGVRNFGLMVSQRPDPWGRQPGESVRDTPSGRTFVRLLGAALAVWVVFYLLGD